MIVTGTRIENGSGLPTPTTVMSLDQLNTQNPTSIPEALAQLPMFAPTLGTTSHTEPNGRGFGTPTNNLNLHNLGTIRTLILMDGNRVPGTFYDTTVNVDMLPQMLVQRVDVVTGGASAVYGSDAVAGVVNYVLDHNFVGFKAQVQGGISTYGDAATARIGFAAGMNVLDKGHFEVSAEYFNRDSVPDASARPYGDPAHSCQTTGSFYLVDKSAGADLQHPPVQRFSLRPDRQWPPEGAAILGGRQEHHRLQSGHPNRHRQRQCRR